MATSDKTTSNNDMIEMGQTGLKRSGGFIDEEFLLQLRGPRGIRVFAEMRDNDPIVGGIMFAIDKLIRNVSWRTEPHEDGNEDDAEFLDQCMRDMSMTWDDFISEIMWSMLPFGFSYHELVYKVRNGFIPSSDKKASSKFNDGKIGWRKMPIRSADTLQRWEFDDDDGSVAGFWQSAPPNYESVYVPIEKALLFRTTIHKNNPEGRSAFRNAYRPWYFKKRIEEIEGIGIERDLAGFPVMYVDPSIVADDAQPWEQALYTEIKKMITNIRRDKQEGAVIPSVYDKAGNQLYRLELLSAGGSRQFDTSTIIDRYNRQITQTVLADFIMLGHEGVGSFALSSDKTNLFATALGSWLKMIRDVVNNYAVQRLWAANGFDLETMPTIEFGDIEKGNAQETISAIAQLATAGATLFPDEELENHLRTEVLNLPAKSDEAVAQQEAGEAAAKDAQRASEAQAATDARNSKAKAPTPVEDSTEAEEDLT
jgi:hypothetical protein